MTSPIVTLTTDFGSDGLYVAQMKGMLWSRRPEARIVDLSHAIPPQDLAQAAVVVDWGTRYFPSSSIHVVVVDPGVGTDRRLLLCATPRGLFLAPDNGVLTRVIAADALRPLIAVDPARWPDLPPRSSTFHGRDLMMPIVAALLGGRAAPSCGEPTESYEELKGRAPRRTARGWLGEVIWVDRFGNLVSNLAGEDWPEPRGAARIRAGAVEIAGCSRTYGEHPPGSLIALFGSQGLLEIAEVNGNAARRLGLERGAAIAVECDAAEDEPARSA